MDARQARPRVRRRTSPPGGRPPTGQRPDAVGHRQRPPAGRLRPDPVLDGPVPVVTVCVELRDWKRTHRALSEEHRQVALAYVTAIIRHDLLLRSASPEEQQAFADRLWRRFRVLYDELRHGEDEDFIRGLRRL